MSKNFVLLFEEKEGSSPLVRLLNNFAAIDILHHEDNDGWEPFDQHNSGVMSLGTYRRCLDMIFDDTPTDMAGLNALYTRTAKCPLAAFDKANAVGFKTRLRPYQARGPRFWRDIHDARFRKIAFDALRRHRVLAFVLVRQDVFRWALSKYHGDGSGQEGHLQFRLAEGEIGRNEIPKIEVNLDAFEKTVAGCERIVAGKQALIEELRANGIEAAALTYEDFNADRAAYFRRLLDRLEVPATDADIAAAFDRGAHFKKVHSDSIEDFVVNAGEVIDRFGHRFAPIRDAASAPS